MMDSVWMCSRREEGKHEETKMQEYIYLGHFMLASWERAATCVRK